MSASRAKRHEAEAFDAAAHAAALAESGPAKGRGDFLECAAACHCLMAAGPGAFAHVSAEMLWPGWMKDLRADLMRGQHIEAARALLALARA